VTAQPSPDLPDLYQEAAEAYCGPAEGWLPPARDRGVEFHRANAHFRAAVDRVAELVGQQVRAELEQRFRQRWGSQGEIEAEIQHYADALAAMTTRAFAAEDRLALAEVHIEEMRDDRDQARAELATMTEVARSNKRHVAMLSDYQDQLTADLAAMTARAESAEAMYDQARAQLAQMTAGRATWKAKALEMERARDLAEVDRDTLAAIRAHDGTGPETGPSATHSPEQATAEGQDPDGPRDSSGGYLAWGPLDSLPKCCAMPDLKDVTSPADFLLHALCNSCGATITGPRTGGAA
jgi:hypothetical protein